MQTVKTPSIFFSNVEVASLPNETLDLVSGVVVADVLDTPKWIDTPEKKQEWKRMKTAVRAFVNNVTAYSF